MIDIENFINFAVDLGFSFNQPIQLKSTECASTDLVALLGVANGQSTGSQPLFRRTFGGSFIKYTFLDWTNIQRITNEIVSNPNFQNYISRNLMHFAMYSTSENNYEYSGSFAISDSNEIFKCNFSEYDRFNIVRDISQIKFSSNMFDFITTQKQLLTWDMLQNYK
ncbi:MAG: hypothetical protein KDC79_01920 [Cyclobacteriaceae bacterium]|nr:hypothetical protein [Cyclobacteriaceae bacterium]